jgi:hypothetical protein
MAICTRRISTLLSVLAVAAVLVPAGNAGLRTGVGARDTAPPAAFPTLYVKYAMNCTFTIVDDNGKTVNSIAPGSYQVYVSTPIMFKLVVPGGPGVDQLVDGDYTGCRGWVQFQLTGPGVNVFTTLDSGCDAFLLLPAQTFKAGATYTAQDLNQPSLTRTTFSTQTSGTPLVPKTPYTATSGKGTTFGDLFGSAIKKLSGTLTGTLSAGGKPALTSKGRPVSTLKAGRYKFVITDRDPKHSFKIQAVKGKPTTLSGVRFVGKKSLTLRLTAGQWKYTSGLGKAFIFRVTD